MIVTTPEKLKRTPTPDTAGSYNHAPFKDEKPSRALMEEDDYMNRYANELPAPLRLIRDGWMKFRQFFN